MYNKDDQLSLLPTIFPPSSTKASAATAKNETHARRRRKQGQASASGDSDHDGAGATGSPSSSANTGTAVAERVVGSFAVCGQLESLADADALAAVEREEEGGRGGEDDRLRSRRPLRRPRLLRRCVGATPGACRDECRS